MMHEVAKVLWGTKCGLNKKWGLCIQKANNINQRGQMELHGIINRTNSDELLRDKMRQGKIAWGRRSKVEGRMYSVATIFWLQ